MLLIFLVAYDNYLLTKLTAVICDRKQEAGVYSYSL